MTLRTAGLVGVAIALMVGACSGSGDGTLNVPTADALVSLVEAASERAESFRIDAPGPSGNGSDRSELTFEFIRPDRMRRATIYRGEEDCPQLSVYLEGVEYRRIPCEQTHWRARPMDAEDLEELEQFYLFPENIVVATLDALIDPEIRQEEMPDGTNVIIVSGLVDYRRFISYFPQFEPEDEGSETPSVSSAEITLLASSYLPLELVFAVPDEESFPYRFSEYGSVPPIEVPSPVAPTPMLLPLD